MRARLFLLAAVLAVVAACKVQSSTGPEASGSSPEPTGSLETTAETETETETEPEPEPTAEPEPTPTPVPICAPVPDEVLALTGIIEGPLFTVPSSRAQLAPSAAPTLDAIATVLLRYPSISFEIRAHQDSKSAEEYRYRAHRPTQRQAAVVREYLIARGVAPERLVAKGYGEEAPLAPNDTAEGRALNRRVELVLVRSADCPRVDGG